MILYKKSFPLLKFKKIQTFYNLKYYCEIFICWSVSHKERCTDFNQLPKCYEVIHQNQNIRNTRCQNGNAKAAQQGKSH